MAYLTSQILGLKKFTGVSMHFCLSSLNFNAIRNATMTKNSRDEIGVPTLKAAINIELKTYA